MKTQYNNRLTQDHEHVNQKEFILSFHTHRKITDVVRKSKDEIKQIETMVEGNGDKEN